MPPEVPELLAASMPRTPLRPATERPTMLNGRARNSEAMVNRTGNFVQDRIPASEKLRSRSLSVAAVERQRGDAVVGDEGLLHRERSSVTPRSRREFEQRAKEDAVEVLRRLGIEPSSSQRFYRVDDEGSYFVQFEESVTVPEGHVGLVRPRDGLRRSGALVETTFLSPGTSRVEVGLFVDDQVILLAEDATLAEVVVVTTEG